MVVDRAAILSLVRSKGPLVTNEIRRSLGIDPLLLGATLSDMKRQGELAMTQVKKGGSAFYYAPEKPESLEPLVQYLNPKDQQTVLRLKTNKALSEATEELFTRVSFRNIPDFARSFMLETPQGQYRCWRYYLVSEAEARELLAPKPKPEPTPEAPVQEQKQEDAKVETKQETTPPRKEPAPEQKKDSLEKNSNPSKVNSSFTPKKPDEAQTNLAIEPSLEATPFYTQLITYFSESAIRLHKEEQLSKEREYSFIITVPSAVGPLRMYAHARNKKKLNEGDAAPALLKAKTLDLPCLFLYTGDFTKKSLQLIKKEYTGLLLKKIK